MRDAFASAARRAFDGLLAEFRTSLLEDFPDCEGCAAWCADDVDAARWLEATRAPLPKGAAKYAKAVTSIVGAPASAHHAIAYRDAAALAKASDFFRPLGLEDKLRGMSREAAGLTWRYLDELGAHARAVAGCEAPRVRDDREIRADIDRRRASKVPAPPVLTQGVGDPGRSCARRGVVADPAKAADLLSAGSRRCSRSTSTGRR